MKARGELSAFVLLGKYQYLSKEYETWHETTEAVIYTVWLFIFQNLYKRVLRFFYYDTFYNLGLPSHHHHP